MAIDFAYPLFAGKRMLQRIRIKLAEWILPNDAEVWKNFGAFLLGSVMTYEGLQRARWQTISGKVYEIRRLKKRQRKRNGNVRCVICTHVFRANPDRPAKCPSCGSRDIERV